MNRLRSGVYELLNRYVVTFDIGSEFFGNRRRVQSELTQIIGVSAEPPLRMRFNMIRHRAKRVAVELVAECRVEAAHRPHGVTDEFRVMHIDDPLRRITLAECVNLGDRLRKQFSPVVSDVAPMIGV
jgi:hypothetical protein